jgi:hypothetical protein
MTFACSRRSLAATALAASLVLPVSASAAGPGPHRTPTPTPGSTPTPGLPQRPSHQVSGLLKGWTNTTKPTELTVKAGDALITVNVSTTTKIVRGYGAQSSLDEFAQDDRLTAQGSFKPGSKTIFNARWIKDWSVQAHSRVVGSVLDCCVQTGSTKSLTLQVARRGNRYSQKVTVTLSLSTPVVSGTVTLTADALKKDMRVLAMGVYNRTQSTLRASRVRILSARRRHT